jgi:hypothetical protein
MADITIKFLKTYTVKSVDGETYLEGSVHAFSESSANHFLRRKVACLASEAPKDLAAPAGEMPPPAPQIPEPPANEREIERGDTKLNSLFEGERSKQGIAEAPKKMPAIIPVTWKFSDNPLVSCIMPTGNREEFITAAIDCWQKQTYQNRELIILDDGQVSVKKLIPKNKMIRYVRLQEKQVLGIKRNQGCEMANGEIICHFDDDDWSAPERIADQVARLRETSRPITGYGILYFWDIQKQKGKRYVATSANYVCGTSLCFLKAYWQQSQFPPKAAQEDSAFIDRAIKLIAASRDPKFMVARIHDKQTVSKANVGQEVPRDVFPAGFWENEEIRLKSGKK